MTRQPFDPNLAVGASGAVPARATRRDQPVSVSELTAWIKAALEDALPPTLHVVGEISNFKRHANGHLYFTLKDQRSEIGCVMWRSAAAGLKFDPADGMDMLVTGAIDVYERSGRYQLYVRTMEPRGVGALELAFRQLCEKLDKEGLFDPAHKKPLPPYPERIAVVTSETGAAVQDIIDTLRRRFPVAAVLLYPVKVQGDGAAAQIAGAIGDLNRRSERLGGVDVLIVGRGGGSIEDLWAFNEEIVARAIFASRIPIISAVGHETDVTIADLVADVRAATPTAAAELAAPRMADLFEELSYRESMLVRRVRHLVELRRSQLESRLHRRAFAEPLRVVDEAARLLDRWTQRTSALLDHRIHRMLRRLGTIEVLLHRLQPQRFVDAQRARLTDAHHRLQLGFSKHLSRTERRLASRAQGLVSASPRRLIEQSQASVRSLERQMRAALEHRVQVAHDRLDRQQARLTALDHRATLARGFSITRHADRRGVVASTRRVKEGDRLVTELHDGTITSKVVDPDQGELFE